MSLKCIHKFFLVLACCVLIGLPIEVKADERSKAPQAILAPGYGSLQFSAPLPGTYSLPSLGKAANGAVVDTNNKNINLHSLMGDKIVLLSFIYSTCNDVNGCPLATAVFHKINRRIQKEPELADKLRLLTLSFNPVHDTPPVMKQYSQQFSNDGVEWKFLTTATEQDLQPILKKYQQSILKIYDEKGEFTETFSHNLRVYLIDKDKRLRNIYGVSFLHPDTLINDIKTLLGEQPKMSLAAKATSSEANARAVHGAGDYKLQYHSASYETRSLALTDRVGQPVNLIETIHNPPLGLPSVPVPPDNPITHEKISLGRKLFYDRRLSLNNTFSCAMCHIPEQGFTNNEMATSVGVEGRTVRRNAPTIYNVGYAERMFHDGRETSLEQQVWGPLLAHNEMANPSIGYVVETIRNSSDYEGLFSEAFGRDPSMETIGMAIASYERTLNSANSPFDRWHYGKQEEALGEAEKRGYTLFAGKAGCVACHPIGKQHAIFTDNMLHNTGVGYTDSMGKGSAELRVQIAPGVFVNVGNETIQSVSEKKPNDLGRYEITQRPEDRWKYKTPSLRNVKLTAPYMHNGIFETLTQVVGFYNDGGVPNDNLDPLVHPLGLNKIELSELVAFLESLTGSNVEQLVSDAFAAPVGDPK